MTSSGFGHQLLSILSQNAKILSTVNPASALATFGAPAAFESRQGARNEKITRTWVIIFIVTLTIQNSKPIVQFLQELSKTASKFSSLQNKDAVTTAQLQEILP